MCGIVGVAGYGTGAITGLQKSTFWNMLVASSARGIDGTGVVKVDTDGNAKIVKRAGDPFNLFKDEQFQKAFWEKLATSEWNRWLLGHNRWATKGKKNTSNAHPFIHKGIILVHNGALRYGTEFDYNKFDVDSQAICHSIGEIGLQETWKKMAGAFAIAYFDHNLKTFNVARNKERPLWIGYGKSSKSVFFASEPDLIRWAVQRNRMVVDDIEEVETNVHYKWSLETDKYEPEKTLLEANEQKMDHTYTDENFWREGASRIDQTYVPKDDKGAIILPDSPDFKEVFTPVKKKHNIPVTYSGYPNGGRGIGVSEEKVVPFHSSNAASGWQNFSKGSSDKPKDYMTTEVFNGLRRLQKVDVRYFDYDELKTQEGKDYFIVKAHSPLYDGLEFRVRYNNADGDDGFWIGISGTFIRGTVVSLLCPTVDGLKKGKGNVAYLVGAQSYVEKSGPEIEFEHEMPALATYIKRNKGKHPYPEKKEGVKS